MRIVSDNSIDPLAHHLKALRQAQGWTLAQLAARSAVSRATLSRIESGAVSPTAQTLGQLATALATPISHLLAPLEEQAQAMVPRDAQPVWTEAGGGVTRRVVSPRGGALRAEVIEVTLAPGHDIRYAAPAVAGQEHHLILRAGTLRMQIDAATHDLTRGDCLRYILRGESRFQSGPDGARYSLVIL